MDQPEREPFVVVQGRHVRQCAKEARIVGLIWLLGLIYCSMVMGNWGYLPPEERPDEPALTFGMPSWAFWGLFFPWLVQIGITVWFAFCVLKDDEPDQEMPK